MLGAQLNVTELFDPTTFPFPLYLSYLFSRKEGLAAFELPRSLFRLWDPLAWQDGPRGGAPAGLWGISLLLKDPGAPGSVKEARRGARWCPLEPHPAGAHAGRGAADKVLGEARPPPQAAPSCPPPALHPPPQGLIPTLLTPKRWLRFPPIFSLGLKPAPALLAPEPPPPAGPPSTPWSSFPAVQPEPA